MTKKTAILLVLSSLVNAAIGFGAFIFGVFATSPQMSDVTMRIGYYVLNAIVLAAVVAMFAPWILVHRQRPKGAVAVAVLPVLLTIIAVVAFLLLDSWLRRTFGG